MNLVLDTDSHDIKIYKGNFLFSEDNEDGINTDLAQRLKTRLLLVKGESYLFPDEGVDYFGQIWIKNPVMATVKALFVKCILETPGVLSISTFTMNYDRAARSLTLDFTVKSAVGEVQIKDLEV